MTLGELSDWRHGYHPQHRGARHSHAMAIHLLRGWARKHTSEEPRFRQVSEVMGVQTQRCIASTDVGVKLKWLLKNSGSALLGVVPKERVADMRGEGNRG